MVAVASSQRIAMLNGPASTDPALCIGRPALAQFSFLQKQFKLQVHPASGKNNRRCGRTKQKAIETIVSNDIQGIKKGYYYLFHNNILKVFLL